MRITDRLPTSQNPMYYDADFRAVLEDHMNFLREHSTTRTLVVAASDAYRFEGDFYRYLCSLGSIDRAFYWVIMRLNRMHSPTEFGSSVETLLIPSTETLESIRRAHITYHSI